MAGLMCVVKGYVDTNILPYVTNEKNKKQKKEKKPAEGGKKKGSWELLTSSPRILNLTLMVGRCRAWDLLGMDLGRYSIDCWHAHVECKLQRSDHDGFSTSCWAVRLRSIAWSAT